MPDLPRGTVTFLFADLEGSTRLLQELGERYLEILEGYRGVIRQATAREGGSVVSVEGDGVFAGFPTAGGAVRAAVAVQRALAGGSWPSGAEVRARIGLHTGEAREAECGYVGLEVHRAARIGAAAHGGQVLLSQSTRELAEEELEGPELGVVDLGLHVLKDLPRPQRLFQLLVEGLPVRFPPPRTLKGERHNLPLQLTSFVGRERELAAVGELLRRSRLVTLAGVAGVGKSRLALEVARSLADELPDGAWWVELAPVSDATLVGAGVAGALGLQEQSGRSLEDVLVEHLRLKELLLVLDNCEHLLEGVGGLAARLLRASAGLRVVATSREILGLHGEVSYAVPPLAAPAATSDAATAGGYDAVRLFVQRAEAARPGFALTPENVAPTVRICRRLDGIPLAIELAAALVRGLSPVEIADRLADRFSLLTGGGREVAPRQQTLQATMDWSYDLLRPGEAALLGRLSVFRGGFDLPQAEAVTGGDPLPEAGVLDALLHLVDKSLVVWEEAADRYRLLETVREYAWLKLVEGGEAEGFRIRHAEAFAELSEQAREGLSGREQRTWLERLEREHDNVRAALRWAAGNGRAEMVARLVASFWRFWRLRGHLSEGRDWLEAAIAARSDGPPDLLAELRHGAGDLAANQGDLPAAGVHFEEWLRLARELGDQSAAAEALARLATLPHKEGDLKQATALFEDALTLARSVGDAWLCGQILSNLALLEEDQGHRAEAEELAAEALSLSRQSGDEYRLADALLAVGEIALNRGELGRAGEALEESLALSRADGFSDLEAWALCYLGELAMREERLADAHALFEEGLARFRELRHPVGTAWALRHMARLLQRIDVGSPAEALAEALQVAWRHVKPDVPIILEMVAKSAHQRGDPERATLLLAAGGEARRGMGLARPPREQEPVNALWEALRNELDEQVLDELTRRGRAMPLDEATRLAEEAL